MEQCRPCPLWGEILAWETRCLAPRFLLPNHRQSGKPPQATPSQEWVGGWRDIKGASSFISSLESGGGRPSLPGKYKNRNKCVPNTPVAQTVKNPPANAGDLSLISGLVRSPGEGHGNPLQYSCLHNPSDSGAWHARAHGVAKSLTRLSTQHLHFLKCTWLQLTSIFFLIFLDSLS